jgi:hypothetical protein
MRNALRSAAAAAAKAASKAAAKENSASQEAGAAGAAAAAAVGRLHIHKQQQQQQELAGQEQQQQQCGSMALPSSNGLTQSYSSQLVQSPTAASADMMATGSKDSGLAAATNTAAAAAAVPSEALGPICARIAAALSVQKERLARSVDPETGAITR